jgi:nitroreductase
MDTLEAIRTRRSIRRYKHDDIPDDILMKLLEAMRLAPSGKNCQPWKFIVVRDKAMKSKVAAACQYRTAKGQLNTQSWVDGAPVIIVGCGLEKETALRYYQDGKVFTAYWSDFEPGEAPTEYDSPVIGDLVIALDHLVLAATAEGIGTCWIGGLDQLQLKELLDIPDDVIAPVAIVLGYPASWPKARPRKPLEEIVCYDRYS